MFPDHLYACLKRDELWRVRGSRSELRESRQEGGHAFTFARRGFVEIRAGDDFQETFTERFTPPSEVWQRLSDQWRDDRDQLRQQIRLKQGRVRVVSIIRYVENEQRSQVSQSTVIMITAPTAHRTISITTNPADLANHLRLLEEPSAKPVRGIDYRHYPMVWGNGSGAVLLHEAIGHPAEQLQFMEWPSWLRVEDNPVAGPSVMQVDDVGEIPATRVLSSGDPPAAFRREDFRSLPLRRMTNLVVTTTTPDMDLPEPRIEVSLLGGGGYDDIRDSVRLSIARAQLIRGGVTQPLESFEFQEPRREIGRRMMGSAGGPLLYPGVICADEGQRLAVGAISPDLVTNAFS